MTGKRPTPGPWLLLFVGLLLCGCGKPDRSCPVTGKVSVNGKPAAGLYFVFHAAGSPPKQGGAVSARTEKDGSFSLRVPEPGEYVITAFWPTVLLEQDETVEGEDSFRGFFRDPQQPASKATIKQGENRLPPVELTFDFGRP